MGTLLKLKPSRSLANASIRIPASKPETQRAIVTASLAQGRSLIHGDLRCSETEATKAALRSMGATITEHEGLLEVTGVAGKPQPQASVIDCHGSGYAFRVMSVLSALAPGEQVLTGDSILQKRPMYPLFNALANLGADIDYLGKPGMAPIGMLSSSLRGGACSVPGDTCSQFTTALLLGLPLAAEPVVLNVTGGIASASYIRQTLLAMRQAGVDLGTLEPQHRYEIQPARYHAIDVVIGGDCTSASYIVAMAALFPCEIRLQGVRSHSLQGERAIFDVVQALGLDVHFDDAQAVCTIRNQTGRLKGHFEFDVKDGPNILPTLGAIGAFVEGEFTVRGASVTSYHKSPRIRAMIEELRKLGVDVEPVLTDDALLDGFTIRGRASYEGGVVLSSWGDHRIFLSLFVASLRCRQANLLEGYEGVHNSFPDFFQQVLPLGVQFEEVADEFVEALSVRAA